MNNQRIGHYVTKTDNPLFEVHFLGKENKVVTKILEPVSTQFNYNMVVFLNQETDKLMFIGISRIVYCEQVQ